MGKEIKVEGMGIEGIELVPGETIPTEEIVEAPKEETVALFISKPPTHT